METTDLIIISFDTTPEHITLIRAINSLTGFNTLQAPVKQALDWLSGLEKEEAARLIKRAARCRVQIDPDLETDFKRKSVKIPADRNKVQAVDDLFREVFHISRIMRPFYLKVILAAFRLYLVAENEALGVKENAEADTVVDLFALAVSISTMLMENNPSDRPYIDELRATMRRRQAP